MINYGKIFTLSYFTREFAITSGKIEISVTLVPTFVKVFPSAQNCHKWPRPLNDMNLCQGHLKRLRSLTEVTRKTALDAHT